MFLWDNAEYKQAVKILWKFASLINFLPKENGFVKFVNMETGNELENIDKNMTEMLICLMCCSIVCNYCRIKQNIWQRNGEQWKYAKANENRESFTVHLCFPLLPQITETFCPNCQRHKKCILFSMLKLPIYLRKRNLKNIIYGLPINKKNGVKISTSLAVQVYLMTGIICASLLVHLSVMSNHFERGV